MHRSRLTAIVIDCLDENFEASVRFWAAALGARPPRALRRGQRYVHLDRGDGELSVMLQRVERDPGIHLDIESDSVPAEVERLEAVGARRKHRVKRWWVMEDPSGHAFCVVRPQQPRKLARRRPWPD